MTEKYGTGPAMQALPEIRDANASWLNDLRNSIIQSLSQPTLIGCDLSNGVETCIEGYRDADGIWHITSCYEIIQGEKVGRPTSEKSDVPALDTSPETRNLLQQSDE